MHQPPLAEGELQQQEFIKHQAAPGSIELITLAWLVDAAEGLCQAR